MTRKKHKHKEEWMKNVVVFFRCWWNDELIKSAAIYFDFCRLRVPMLMSIISFFCRLSLFFDFNIFSIISKCILEYVSVSLFARFLSFFARSIYHFTYHFYERKKKFCAFRIHIYFLTSIQSISHKTHQNKKLVFLLLYAFKKPPPLIGPMPFADVVVVAVFIVTTKSNRNENEIFKRK